MKQSPVNLIIIVFLSVVFNACINSDNANNSLDITTETEAMIYNVDNGKNSVDFNKLELDKSHPNLLDPKNPNSKNDSIRNSWIKLHQNVVRYLSDHNFSWNTDNKRIKSFQKIYFDSNGKITHYYFKIINEDVSEDTKEEFAKLLAEFSKNFMIDIQKEHPFAQCGSTAYQNL